MAVRKKASTTKKAGKAKTTKKTTAKVRKTTVRAAKTKKPAAKTTAKKTTAKRSTAAKKTTARKAPARKTAGKKTSTAKTLGAVPRVSDPFTKSQLMTTIADMTDVPKKDVGLVFDALNGIIEKHLQKRGPRNFTLPGLVKFQVIRKKARKARKGINPFTGEEMMFKAKPAQDVVKARLLKKVKEMVE